MENETEKTIARFFKFVEFTDSCWLWTGGLTTWGYGQFSEHGVQHGAHRWIFELVNGKQTLPLDHLCRVRRCVNPDHLEAVPHRINILRGVGLTAMLAQRDACKHGHLLTPDNLLPTGNRRYRRCRECTRRDSAVWRTKEIPNV